MQRKSGARATIFWAGPALALLALAAAGCPGNRTAPAGGTAKPYDGVVLKVACPGDPAAAAVGRYSRPWAAKTGAKVEVVRYDPAGDPPAADAWVLAPAEMPRWAAAGKLLAVPDATRARDAAARWQGLLPLYRDRLLVWNHKTYAFPLLGEAPVCFYRADLFEEQGKRPPETWEAFADLAEHFQKTRKSPSLPPLPDSADGLDRLFFTVAAPFVRRAVRGDEQPPPPTEEMYSFHYDLKTGQPYLDAAGFVAGLRLLKRMQACRPEGASPAPPEAFRDGKAVLCLADASWVARFQKSDAVRGKFGVCRVPGSARYYSYPNGTEVPVKEANRLPYLGAAGWLAVVPKAAANAEAALALLAELTGPETSRQIVFEPEWGGGALRPEQLERGAGWNSFGLDAARQAELLSALRQSLEHPQAINPALRLRTPDARAKQRAVVEGVRAALAGGKEPAAALKAAADRWRELDRAKGAGEPLTEYRVSLGIEPPR
ncbi:MAG TPA: extracellular solute-binding protein [Gemmataceae bacterium]|nr:extracellular solute-binding protein [Gemmataceae bacterium]